MVYYIDAGSGTPDGSGRSPREARKTCEGIPIRPGDTVLLKASHALALGDTVLKEMSM